MQNILHSTVILQHRVARKSAGELGECAMNNSDSMDTIQERLISDDHGVYLHAVRGLQIAPKDQVSVLLWELSQAHTGRIQARLLNPLRTFAPELSSALALQILNDDFSQFHFDALYSLWKTQSPMGLSRAVELMATHSDSIVRMWCATYLGSCGTMKHIPALQYALNDLGTDEEGREVCKVAAAAIQEILDRAV